MTERWVGPLFAGDAGRRLTDRAREALRTAIIDGRLVPSRLYSVAELAADLGVSRTPVREALITLERERMVRLERNRGFRVLQTSLHDLQEIFALRLLLEVPSTYLATGQMRPEERARPGVELAAMREAADARDEQRMWHHDRRFHRVIHEASGNLRLASDVDRLRDIVLSKGATTAPLSRSLSAVVDEHEAIAVAIVAGAPAAAAAAMKDHVLHTGTLLLAQEGGQEAGDALRWASLVNPHPDV